MKPINVLSLFDGMSCGQIALERAGIPVANYYASEIDKWAMKVTQCHYPKTVQLGTILNWKDWQLPKIDLVIAGSPCQGFSKAGKGLNFDDPRSKLFFTYMDILNDQIEKNYKVLWLLENVKMKKEWRDVISNLLGGEPVIINSALVSAQNRERLYWANFPISQPEDKEIFLKDIIETGEVDRTKRIYSVEGKSPTLNAGSGGNLEPKISIKTIAHGYIKEKEEQKDKYPSLCAQDPSSKHLIRTKSNTIRVGGKGSPPNSKQCWDNVYMSRDEYRKLTPLECERLQTVEDNWTSMVSDHQRYRMLGNGWTVDTIVHILNCSPLKTS